MACRRASAYAFTLVELMIVVILLGMIAAMVVPDLRGSAERSRMESGARRIADLCDLGYRSAVGTGRVHALVFERDGRKYALLAESAKQNANPGAPSELEPVRLPGTIGSELPEGVKLTSAAFLDETLSRDEVDRVRILFFPDGTTEYVVLTLTGESGDRRKIMLNGLSGTVTVEEAGPEQNGGGENA